MTFTEHDHPRTAAGAPGGGQFAAKPAGAEAETIDLSTNPDDERLAGLVRLLKAVNEVSDTAERETAKAMESEAIARVAGTCEVVLDICPDATRVHWKLAGRGIDDTPDLAVTCPHGDNVDQYTFEEAHSVPSGTIASSPASGLVAATADQAFDLEFSPSPYYGYSFDVDPNEPGKST